ncbi:protein kinase family protein [Smaragdicoccus niigatensis]
MEVGDELSDDVEATGAAAPPPRRRGALVPGAAIGGGRYRLLAEHGGTHNLQFWQARDTRLERDVAITIVPTEPDAKISNSEQNDILTRTLRLGKIASPGLTRVLDVTRSGSTGLVIAEWTPGASLREACEGEPNGFAAARAVAVLAQAAEEAHGDGSTLSIEHPDQIRISADGKAVLAFPGSHSGSDVESDVRGLGAVLYALLTGRWALGTADAGAGGLEPAVRGDNGKLVDPSDIHPDLPFEISAVALRALGADRGVRTAATVQHVLEQASAGYGEADYIPPVRLGQKPVEVDPEQNKRTFIALGVLGVVTVVLFALIGSWIMGLLAGGGNDTSLSDQGFGFATSSTTTTTGKAPEPEGIPLFATGADVFSPKGSPDNADSAGYAIDNDESTKWSTDSYAAQFPSYKEGVGLLLTLPKTSRILTATINTDSPGTVVEIRTARSSSPENLSDTTLVSAATTLQSGENEIKLNAPDEVRYVIVWITKLADPKKQSSIIEVSFTTPQQ